MGWCEYYQTVRPVSLSEQGYAYAWAVDILTKGPSKGFLEKESITALLGGFHTHSATAPVFPTFCYHLHPNLNNKLIYFDMNQEPLCTSSSPMRVRGRLEELPFSDQSIDLMVLDHTLDFMDNRQVSSFAKETQRVLTPEGIVLAAIHDGLFTKYRLPNTIQRIYRTLSHHVNYYPRSAEMVSELFNDMTVNLEGGGKRFCLLAFSRPQSPYPVFHGDPYALYEDIAPTQYFLPAPYNPYLPNAVTP